jgi:hypothetical protein
MIVKERIKNKFDYKLKIPSSCIENFLIFTSSKLRGWKQSGF